MKKNVNVWDANGKTHRTTWWEKRKGGKRRFLKTLALDVLPPDVPHGKDE